MAISVTTQCKKLTTEKNSYCLKQLSHLAVFSSNVQCVRFVDDTLKPATDQWCDQPNAAAVASRSDDRLLQRR